MAMIKSNNKTGIIANLISNAFFAAEKASVHDRTSSVNICTSTSCVFRKESAAVILSESIRVSFLDKNTPALAISAAIPADSDCTCERSKKIDTSF